MADGKAGRPRVLHRRLVRDATEDEREHELAVKKADNDSRVLRGALESVLKRAPDLALLGGGYYLGSVMNMRPGLTVPVIGFIGFPDFGGRIDELKEDVKNLQAGADAIRKNSIDCLNNCEEIRRLHERAGTLDQFDMAECLRLCAEEEGSPTNKELQGNLSELKAELRKHTVAQGILMATIVYAVTRAGFLQGIGEIIPG